MRLYIILWGIFFSLPSLLIAQPTLPYFSDTLYNNGSFQYGRRAIAQSDTGYAVFYTDYNNPNLTIDYTYANGNLKNTKNWVILPGFYTQPGWLEPTRDTWLRRFRTPRSSCLRLRE